ncbi:MAG: hypothetical protein GF349_02635 [Candidatus Magasanikbacteria bacterium]|nr:hypothetical protein [Candidatus Magasanikbacteria bacterium]
MKENILNLFKILINKKPVGVPTELLETANKKYQYFLDNDVSDSEIEKELVEFGKKIWPYLQAEQEFVDKYGKEKHKDLFLEKLKPELRKKWEEFTEQGGDIHDFRKGDDFEKKFNADENYEIEQAIINTKQEILQFIEKLAKTEKSEEYFSIVEEYKEREEKILKKLEELRQLKERGDKWDDEIEDLIHFFEKGFAELEEKPTLEKVQAKIDWYEGQINSGNA